MDHHAARPRRVLVGLAAMAVGAAAVVAGLASAAAAHEGTEPEKRHDNPSCADLAAELGVGQDWEEFKVEGFPDSATYTLSDRGTPDDDSDDATVTITVTGPKNFDWSSNVGIDAVFVKGGNAHGSYFYYYDGEELTSDRDYTVPPYGQPQNDISHITFCWDDEQTPPSSSSTSSSSSVPDSSTSTSEAPTTSSTMAPTTSEAPTTSMASTTEAPTTTVSSGGGLPVTGSNTGLLVAVGAGLLAAGGVLVATTRQYWRRLI
jgi:hypothetical protein